MHLVYAMLELHFMTRKCKKDISNGNSFSLRGNIIGEYPYKRGTPCSKCASGKGFCYRNLCSEYEFSGLGEDDIQGF